MKGRPKRQHGVSREKTEEEQIMKANHVMNTYSRYDLIFEEGRGPWLTDISGERYLDFVSGIAVNCLGHSAPQIAETVARQSEKLMHISNLYWSPQQIELADRLCQASGFDKVFFCNSGTESNETALKIARKYGRAKGGEEKTKIICMHDSFHGRSLGALSVTGQEKYRQAFRPLIGDVYDAVFNDVSSVEALMDDRVCAVILEPVQGESGIIPADPEFLRALRALCEKYDALLIFDEVQCGMGRSGKLFAHQKYGVMPDICTTAKALGAGFPIGAVLASDKAAEFFVPGDHGCTFGGNPLACACGITVMRELTENGILENAEQMGDYLQKRLQQLADKYDAIEEVRGMGLLIGVQMKEGKKSAAIDGALKQKLMLAGAGNETVRFLPPLNISREELDEGLKRFEAAVEAL